MRERAPAVGIGLLGLALLAGCASVPEASPRVPSGARTITLVGDRPVTVAAGEPGESQTITADPAPPVEADRRIAGRVVDEDGEPVPEAVIRLAVDGAGAGRSVEVTTDPAGRFGLSRLRRGSEYTLIAEWEDERGDLRTGRRVVVAPESNVEIVLRSGRRAGRVGTASDRREVDEDDAPGAPRLADEAPTAVADEPPPARPADELVAGEAIPEPEGPEILAPETAEPRLADTAEAGAVTSGNAWRRGGTGRAAREARYEPREPDPAGATNALALPEPDDEGANPLPPAREPGPSVVMEPDGGLAPEPIREPDPAGVRDLAGSGPAPPPFPPDPTDRPSAPAATPPEPIATAEPAGAPSEALIDAALKGQGTSREPAPAAPPADAPAPAPPAAPVLPASPPEEPRPEGVAEPPATALLPEDPAPAPPAMPALAPEVGGTEAVEPAPPEQPDLPPAPDVPADSTDETPPTPEPTPAGPPEPTESPEPVSGPEPPAEADQAAEAPPVEPEAPPPIGESGGPPPIGEEPPASPDPAPPSEPAPELPSQPAPSEATGEETTASRATAPAPRVTWGQLSAQVEHQMRPTPAAIERAVLDTTSRPRRRAPEPVAPATFTQASCRYDARHRRLEAFTLADVGGKPVRLADLDADLVLLDFWGTWCGPCLKAIPELVDLQATFGPRLKVVGIAYEQGEPAEWAERIGRVSEREGINYGLLVGEADGRPCPLRAALQVQAFPTLVLIDREGQVLWRDQGATPANVRRLRRVIEAKLNVGLAARDRATSAR